MKELFLWEEGIKNKSQNRRPTRSTLVDISISFPPLRWIGNRPDKVQFPASWQFENRQAYSVYMNVLNECLLI